VDNDNPSTDLAVIEHQSAMPTQFGARGGLPAGTNAGAVAIESERAIAEAQGQLILAKRFPRDVMSAIAELLEACKNPDFAASAFYAVPNRGSGPSIRFAEECANVCGNFQYGHRELSRTKGASGVGQSEVEVYAWDMEKNNRSTRQITVKHVVDTKNGPRALRDETDIDNKIANVAAKQMRGRLLALMPKHLVAAGIAECKKTIAGANDQPISQRLVAMVSAFSKYGVTGELIVKYLGHSLDGTTLDELVDLTGVYNAIKEGAKPSEYFGGGDEPAKVPDAGAAAIMAEVTKTTPPAEPAKAAARKAAPKPDPTPTKPAPAAAPAEEAIF
jgi:hypothetical protein